jgi:PPOX class probable F420-dependent enzyme
MNRRAAIQLTPEEQREFLETSRTAVLSTIDRRGYPHAIAMWYVIEDGCALMTTYAKSQKAVNVRRNPKVALVVESGTTYDTLKGVLIRGTAELIDDEETCLSVLMRVHEKMQGSIPDGIEEALREQARKRLVIRVRPERVSSWDHSKLGGTY